MWFGPTNRYPIGERCQRYAVPDRTLGLKDTVIQKAALFLRWKSGTLAFDNTELTHDAGDMEKKQCA